MQSLHITLHLTGKENAGKIFCWLGAGNTPECTALASQRRPSIVRRWHHAGWTPSSRPQRDASVMPATSRQYNASVTTLAWNQRSTSKRHQYDALCDTEIFVCAIVLVKHQFVLASLMSYAAFRISAQTITPSKNSHSRAILNSD